MKRNRTATGTHASRPAQFSRVHEVPTGVHQPSTDLQARGPRKNQLKILGLRRFSTTSFAAWPLLQGHGAIAALIHLRHRAAAANYAKRRARDGLSADQGTDSAAAGAAQPVCTIASWFARLAVICAHRQ